MIWQRASLSGLPLDQLQQQAAFLAAQRVGECILENMIADGATLQRELRLFADFATLAGQEAAAVLRLVAGTLPAERAVRLDLALQLLADVTGRGAA